tara:strand:- start:84 stop:788 length:705 start_codon:yes stop_codon:yes gene_type:complete
MGKRLIGSVGLKPGTDTGFDLDEKGQIHGYTDTQFALPVGDDNQILSSLASEASGLKWVTPTAGGSLKLLESETLGADTSAWAITFSSAYEFDDYTNFIVIFESDADGTSGASDLTFKLNNLGSGYHYIMNDWTGTSQTLTNAAAQSTGLITDNYVQGSSNYTMFELFVNSFASGERYAEYRSTSCKYTDLTNNIMSGANSAGAVTDFSKIEFIEAGDGDILAGSIITIYGYER